MPKEILVKTNTGAYRQGRIMDIEIEEQKQMMTGNYVTHYNFLVELTDGDMPKQYWVQDALNIVVTSDGREEMHKGGSWKPVFGITKK